MQPPEKLQADKTYQPGEMACLGESSLLSPMVIFHRQTTFTTNPTTGKASAAFNYQDQAEIIWPTWDESVDYASHPDPLDPDRPRVWLVWWDGALWYPTYWYVYSSDPPPYARVGQGESAGARNVTDYQNPAPGGSPYVHPKLVNRGTPTEEEGVCPWMRVHTSMEELDSLRWWNSQMPFPSMFGDPNPVGVNAARVCDYPIQGIHDYCRGALQVVPIHMVPEYVPSPGNVEQYKQYRPSFDSPYRHKIVESKQNDQAGQYVNSFTEPDDRLVAGQPPPNPIATVYDLPGWDLDTGRFQQKTRSAEIGPYLDFKLNWSPPGRQAALPYSPKPPPDETETNEPPFPLNLYWYSALDDCLKRQEMLAGVNLESPNTFDAGASWTLWHQLATTTYVESKQTVPNISGTGTTQFYRASTTGQLEENTGPAENLTFLVHPAPMPGYYGPTGSGIAFSPGGFSYGVELNGKVLSDTSTGGPGSTVTTTTTITQYICKAVHPLFIGRTFTLQVGGLIVDGRTSSSPGGSNSTVNRTRLYRQISFNTTPQDKLIRSATSDVWVEGVPTALGDPFDDFTNHKFVDTAIDYYYGEQWGTGQYVTSVFTSKIIGSPSTMIPSTPYFVFISSD